MVKRLKAVFLLAVCPLFSAYAQEVSPSITGEFLWGGGLYQIGAHEAYDQGITGNGVTLAVLDTGVNYYHPELFTQVAPGGYDFYNATFDYFDYNGHGTLVSGIIAAQKDEFGTHGVAYNSRVLPIKVTSNDGTLFSADAIDWGLFHAVQEGATAVNYSATYATGNGFTIDDFAVQASTAFAYTAFGGTIIVAPTGNSTAPNPVFPALLPYVKPENHKTGVYNFSPNLSVEADDLDWSYSEGHILAVAATDTNGIISEFSNRCGVAAPWCLAAPGEDIIAPFWYDTYIDASGTSLSAPFVTGAIGLLKELFPTLTNAQLVELILSTANKQGIYADQNTYGQGFLDIAAAIQPQGTLLLVGSNGVASSNPFQNSTIQTGGAFGPSLLTALQGKTSLIEDRFNRTYTVNLSSRVQTTRPFTLRQEEKMEYLSVAEAFTTRQLSDDLTFTSLLPERTLPDKNILSNSFWAYEAGAQTFNFKNGIATLWTKAPEENSPVGLLKNRIFEPAYLDMVSNGQAINWQYALTPETNLNMTWHEGENLFQENLNATAITGGINWQNATGHKRLKLTFGHVNEEQSTLGTVATGAFALAPHSRTSFLGANGAWPIAQNTSVLGSFYMGQTEAHKADTSLIRSVSTLKHQQASIGLEHRKLWHATDKFTVALEHPLRVTSGSFTLEAFDAGTPQANEFSGFSIGLSPKHQEKKLHMFYESPLPSRLPTTLDGQYALQLSLSDNTNHTNDKKAAEILFYVQAKF